MRPVTNFWTASKKNNLLYLSKNGAVERALNSPMLVMTPTPQNAAVPMVPAAEFVERYFMLFLAWSFDMEMVSHKLGDMIEGIQYPMLNGMLSLYSTFTSWQAF